MKSMKIVSLVCLTFALICSSLRFKEIDNLNNVLTKEFKERLETEIFKKIDEVNSIDFKKEKTFSYEKSSDFVIESNTNDKEDKADLCDAQLQYLYNQLDESTIKFVGKNVKEIPGLSYFYNVGSGNASGEDFINNDYTSQAYIDDFETYFNSNCKKSDDESESLADKTKNFQCLGGSLAIGLSTVVIQILSTIIGFCTAAISVLWIPFVGVACALIQLAIIAIIVQQNITVLRCAFNEIKNYLVTTFSKIGNLISDMFNAGAEAAIDDSFDDAYDKTKNKVGTGSWTRDGLKDGIGKALKLKGTNTDALSISNFYQSNRPVVFLGRWNENKNYCSYFTSSLNNGTCFYMDSNVWNDYINNGKSYDDMWILNVFFS